MAPVVADMPPTMALLALIKAKGDPGGAEPIVSPKAMMVPIGVPSVFKISTIWSMTPFRSISASASPSIGSRTKDNRLNIKDQCSPDRLAIEGYDVR
ncbi:MAG: hypothetical protein EXQ58_06780 [Acidobacteria bacterium]|nr:hypothetical protein [Acidobacteriota bacterium]